MDSVAKTGAPRRGKIKNTISPTINSAAILGRKSSIFQDLLYLVRLNLLNQITVRQERFTTAIACNLEFIACFSLWSVGFARSINKNGLLAKTHLLAQSRNARLIPAPLVAQDKTTIKTTHRNNHFRICTSSTGCCLVNFLG